MRAVVCHDFNESSVEDVSRPSPGPGEVVVDVRRVQLSVTECNLYRGEKIAHYEAVKARLEDGPARLFGHEFCGIVAETGADVSDFEGGERVYAPGKIPCTNCAYCAAGYPLYCIDKDYLGYDRPGALAEAVVTPAGPLRRLPTGVSDAEGAALQPFASAVLCMVDAGIDTGDVVGVIGTGVMGFQCAQLADLMGARQVVVSDIDPRKLAIAREWGLDTVDARESDPAAVVTKQTNGIGADVVVEAVGGQQSHATDGSDPLAQAMRMVRRGGRVVQVGHIIDDIVLTPRAARAKSIDWVHPVSGAARLGPNTDTGDLAGALVASGRASIDRYISHELAGLAAFESAVDITLDKDAHDALGPAQLVLDRGS